MADHLYTGDTNINAGRLNLNGSLMSNVNVAAGGTIGGEGSTTGSLTFVNTASISGVSGLTAAALSTTDAVVGLDLTGVSASGITVNIDFGGPGAFTVLDYGGTATGFTAGSGARSSPSVPLPPPAVVGPAASPIQAPSSLTISGSLAERGITTSGGGVNAADALASRKYDRR